MLHVVTSALSDAGAERSRRREEAEDLMDALTVMIKETELRIRDMQRDAYDFKKEIVLGAEHPVTGRTMAERVVRYLEGRLCDRDVAIERLRLENAALLGKRKRIESQLRQKEEAGDSFHYIDFHKVSYLPP